jgi:hypothetical protein
MSWLGEGKEIVRPAKSSARSSSSPSIIEAIPPWPPRHDLERPDSERLLGAYAGDAFSSICDVNDKMER